MNRDSIWLVDYIPYKEMYRISRYAEPKQTVAYEDYWSDAVKDIKGNYGSAAKIILIKKADGTVDYWCDLNNV